MGVTDKEPPRCTKQQMEETLTTCGDSLGDIKDPDKLLQAPIPLEFSICLSPAFPWLSG